MTNMILSNASPVPELPSAGDCRVPVLPLPHDGAAATGLSCEVFCFGVLYSPVKSKIISFFWGIVFHILQALLSCESIHTGREGVCSIETK